MDKDSSDIKFVAERITKLRMQREISEYQLSLDLGFSKGYIQAVSSGSILPSLGALYKICEYFEITPEQFFAGKNSDTKLFQNLVDMLREMSLEEQYTLYQFLRGAPIPKRKLKKQSNRASQEKPRQESDK